MRHTDWLILVSTNTLGSSLGTGGMETKLIAAEIATAAGVTTVITSSRDPKGIFRIIEYNNALKSSTSTPLTPLSGQSTPALAATGLSGDDLVGLLESRPPHTLFKPSPTPLRDAKSWTTHTLTPAGSVIIDSGAHHVLSKRESGGRLLAAGVLGIRGAFASGQAVRIVVRRLPASIASNEHERECETAKARDLYIKAMATEPSTPNMTAIAAQSTSISAIDGLLDTSLAVEQSTPSAHARALPDDDHVLLAAETNETDDWELEEVGRGLANYNSAQIARVKGLKRQACAALTPECWADTV